MDSKVPGVTEESLTSVGLSSSELDWDRLGLFHESLYSVNATRNLTRVAPEDAWVRHYLDSLLFQDLISEGSAVLDIGTGPGFPAWPLAWARPDLQVTAIDSNGKMLGFLQSQPLPNLTAILVRAEDWDQKESFDVVTGRAVAPLATQLELSAAFAKVGGFVLPMRSGQETFGQELIKPLGLQLERVVSRPLPGTDVTRQFPLYRKVTKTGQKYPRRWSEMKAKPLFLGPLE